MLVCINCGFVGSRNDFIYVSSSGSGTVLKCPYCESVGDTRELPEDEEVEND